MPAEDEESNRLYGLRAAFDAKASCLSQAAQNALSGSAPPCTRECAEALLAFADWFGELTPDTVSMIGTAWKVGDALDGLQGVLVTVAFRSVPLANQIEGEAVELIAQADKFDDAIAKAHTVYSTAHSAMYARRLLHHRTYDRLLERMETVAGLARRLGQRLMQIAVSDAGVDARGTPSTSRVGDDPKLRAFADALRTAAGPGPIAELAQDDERLKGFAATWKAAVARLGDEKQELIITDLRNQGDYGERSSIYTLLKRARDKGMLPPSRRCVRGKTGMMQVIDPKRGGKRGE